VQLTDRINRIQISPTAAVINAAEQLKAKAWTSPILARGNPTSPRPITSRRPPSRHRRESLQVHAHRRNHAAARSDCGMAQARAGSDYTGKECVVNVGGKHAIFNTVSVLIQHGDEVILPAPYWVSFPDIIKYAGGTPVIVQTRAENGFGPKRRH